MQTKFDTVVPRGAGRSALLFRALLLATALAAAPTAARGSDPAGHMKGLSYGPPLALDFSGLGRDALNALIGIGVGVGGLVAALGNGIILAQGRKPSTAWRVVGYSFAGLGLGFGAYVAITSRGSDVDWAVGLGTIGLGALDLGFSIWGETRR